MKVEKRDSGFQRIMHDTPRKGELVAESSFIGDYPDAWEKQGSSYLWIGDHHLCREEVQELVGYLQMWLETGRLTRESSESL